MNKTVKTLSVFAVVTTLAAGSLFAQPKPADKPDAPAPQPMQQPGPGQDFNQGKLLGIVDEVTNNTFTFIDMDGKKVTVAVTPFTDIQDIEKERAVDPKAKDAREQMKHSYLSLNQLKKGHWVNVQAYRTNGGKLVAEFVQVIRMPAGGDAK